MLRAWHHEEDGGPSSSSVFVRHCVSVALRESAALLARIAVARLNRMKSTQKLNAVELLPQLQMLSSMEMIPR